MNSYHKGRYRCRERGKHLRPFLKRKGNKRWRKDAAPAISAGFTEDAPVVFRRTGRNKKYP